MLLAVQESWRLVTLHGASDETVECLLSCVECGLLQTDKFIARVKQKQQMKTNNIL